MNGRAKPVLPNICNHHIVVVKKHAIIDQNMKIVAYAVMASQTSRSTAQAVYSAWRQFNTVLM